MFKVAVIVGSLRKESINKKLAHALDKLQHPQLQLAFIQIDDIPLYNEDLYTQGIDKSFPAGVVRLKDEIAAADAVLFVTPEYNRSIPGVLKNIIDWGSRPYGKNSWARKPTAIVGTSPSPLGTALAQAHLRTVMLAMDAVLLGQPEVYLAHKDGLIDDAFNVTVENTRTFLRSFLDRFAEWIKMCQPQK